MKWSKNEEKLTMIDLPHSSLIKEITEYFELIMNQI